MSQHEYFHHSKAVTDLNAIALRALGTLVTGTSQSTMKTQSDIGIQTTLLKAAGNEDWGCFDRAIAGIVATGASYEDIANIHVPAVARILGQAWIDGEADFSTVSIGCARLQGYLRQKGLDWCDTASLTSKHIATVLLVAPQFEQHTLGVTLLAGQLRAQGVDVILAYHATDEKIERTVRKHTCDAIMITCSRSETLALLRSEVLKLKANSACAPIIVGGNVLDQIPDTLIRTGADFTARSCKDALEILTSEKLVRKADPVGGKG